MADQELVVQIFKNDVVESPGHSISPEILSPCEEVIGNGSEIWFTPVKIFKSQEFALRVLLLCLLCIKHILTFQSL